MATIAGALIAGSAGTKVITALQAASLILELTQQFVGGQLSDEQYNDEMAKIGLRMDQAFDLLDAAIAKRKAEESG